MGRVVSLVIAACVLLTTWNPPCAGEESERLDLRPALLVIDVQNIWMPRMSEEDRTSAPQRVNDAISLFRELGHPVIRVYHSDPKRGPEPGTEPFEFPASIAVTEDDLRIIKAKPSAFTETDLEQILRGQELNTVFLCGLSATGCVLATYFGAKDRGFLAAMVEGALLSHNSSYTKVIEDICSSMTVEEMREALDTTISLAGWRLHTDLERGFELRYPDSLLTVSETNGTVTFRHSISLKHIDPCDFDDDVSTLDELVDFHVTVGLWHKGLAGTVRETSTGLVIAEYLRDDTLKVEHGFIDRVSVGSLKGFRITSGVEGCGASDYYFPLSGQTTVHVVRKHIAEFDPINRDYEHFLALPGTIGPDKEAEIFRQMLSTFRVSD